MRIHMPALRDQSVIPNEPEIVALIRTLLAPSGVHCVVPVSEGSDHWVFEVNGTFIARVRKHTDEHTAAAIEHEAALLEIVSHVSPDLRTGCGRSETRGRPPRVPAASWHLTPRHAAVQSVGSR